LLLTLAYDNFELSTPYDSSVLKNCYFTSIVKLPGLETGYYSMSHACIYTNCDIGTI